jgi:hypothetical protein
MQVTVNDLKFDTLYFYVVEKGYLIKNVYAKDINELIVQNTYYYLNKST